MSVPPCVSLTYSISRPTSATDGRNPIEAATVDAAAQIGHYFLGHALAVFDFVGADPLINDARHVLDWFARTRTTRFTCRVLLTVEAAAELLSISRTMMFALIKTGEIVSVRVGRLRKAGRPWTVERWLTHWLDE